MAVTSRVSEDILHILRQSSTRFPKMFHFSEVTEDVSFAELVEFPKIVFFGSILDFSESLGFSRRLPKVNEDVLLVQFVGFRNINFFDDVRFAR